MTETRYHRYRATSITPEKWQATRDAVDDAVDRFSTLVLSVDPNAMATADWTVADTAAHVASVAWLNTALVGSDRTPFPLSNIGERIATTTVDNIHAGLNAAMLRSYSERAPGTIVDGLRSSVAEILHLTKLADPARTVDWLGASTLPLAGLLAHLTNELLLHGRDIARAVGRPWKVPDTYAAQFFELFLVEIARTGAGHLLDDDRPVRPGRIAVQFRSAYTPAVTMVLDTGRSWVEEPSRDNDVQVYFRPAALSLALFHRISWARAAMTGSVRVWGRRPWLLAPFLRKIRFP